MLAGFGCTLLHTQRAAVLLMQEGGETMTLHEARLRGASPARAEFAHALATGADELTLAALIAAEERHSEVLPAKVVEEVQEQIAALADKANERMNFEAALGAGAGMLNLEAAIPSLATEKTCTAVSMTLFGSGAPEDGASAGEDGNAAPFFSGNDDDYYNPKNSFVDQVLQNRCGNPSTLSLVYKACTAKVGTPLVGLNAPGHLLLAPEDDITAFVVDPFVGTLMDTQDLHAFVGARLPPSLPAPIVNSFVDKLRREPMNRLDWVARALRNLRLVYAKSGDYARLLGASERFLLISRIPMEPMEPMEPRAPPASGAASMERRRTDAVPRDGGTRPPIPTFEVLQAEREVGMALYRLGDEERRGEARDYLQRSVDRGWDAELSPESKAALELLLTKEPYFDI